MCELYAMQVLERFQAWYEGLQMPAEISSLIGMVDGVQWDTAAIAILLPMLLAVVVVRRQRAALITTEG